MPYVNDRQYSAVRVGDWLEGLTSMRLASRKEVTKYICQIMTMERCEQAQTCVCGMGGWVRSNGAIVRNQTGEVKR